MLLPEPDVNRLLIAVYEWCESYNRNVLFPCTQLVLSNKEKKLSWDMQTITI